MPKCRCGTKLNVKRVQVGVWFTVKRKCSNCDYVIEVGQLQFKCPRDKSIFCENCVSSSDPKEAGGSAKAHAAAGPMGRPDAGLPGVSLPGVPMFAPDLIVSDDTKEFCKYGVSCFDFDIEHRQRCRHPPGRTGLGLCPAGRGCIETDRMHLLRFVHPGDRNYRHGLICFEPGEKPDFKTLWEIFEYYDPDESGHLSEKEFLVALEGIGSGIGGLIPELMFDEAWEASGGREAGYVNFPMFVQWMQEIVGIDQMPLGVDNSAPTSRACRTVLCGQRCPCKGFQASSEPGLCVCGHKLSAHRTSVQIKPFGPMQQVAPQQWVPGYYDCLVRIEDPQILQRLQFIMQASRKPPPDNWTRDRGCHYHGVNGCKVDCASKHRVKVPSNYHLKGAYRNQNFKLWHRYQLAKAAAAEECQRVYKADPFKPVKVVTSGHLIDAPIDEAINEWYLFHGSSPEGCKSICQTNFRLNLAGSGATWKDKGKDVGTPLYGYGIYLAERSTKSDEYSGELVPRLADQKLPPKIPAFGQQVHCMLLCRCVGGRANVVTCPDIDKERLRSEVFEGPYNSVFGDRVSALKKPYNEVVLYDKDQCYPEFLLVYQRIFD